MSEVGPDAPTPGTGVSAWPLTRRGTGLLAAALAAWLLGRLFGVAELSMAAVAMVALVALALVATRALSGRIHVRRRVMPAHLHIDQQGTVEVELRNLGRMPTAGVRADDGAPSLIASTSRFSTRPLRGGESVRLRYALAGRRRGRYLIGPAVVELRDPFGIARRQVAAGGRNEVVVYPRVVALADGPPLAGHLGTGSDGPPRPGPAGDELANIREYVHGDDLRHVHWRSTAHRGRLMVRQEENRQRPEAVVLLDRGDERHVVTAASSSFETMVTAAASVLWLLQGRQFRLRLVDAPLQRSPRPMAWEQTMTHLAMSEPEPVDVVAMWRQMERGAAGEGSLVAIVPTPDPTMLRLMVRAGRTFGARVALVIDPPDAPRSQGFSRHDAQTAAAALRTAGWYAVVVSPNDALDARWAELSARRGGSHSRRTNPTGAAT